MADDSGKRLLLNALLKGLAYAIRQDDQSAAERYRQRLHLVAEEIAADEPVQDALKRLLLISGLWVEAAKIDRDETRQRMLELIVRVVGLLTPWWYIHQVCGNLSAANATKAQRTNGADVSFWSDDPDWSDETTDNPLYADDRNFYKVEK
jgi:hypothetical protein